MEEVNIYNRNKALVVTVVVHVTVLLLMLLSFKGCVNMEDMETSSGGLMVSFGEVNAGGGDPNADPVSRPQDEPVVDPNPNTPDPNSSPDAMETNDNSDAPAVNKAEKKEPTKKETKKKQMDSEFAKRMEQLKKRKGNNNDGEGEGENDGKEGDPDSDNDGPPGTGQGPVGSGQLTGLSGFGWGEIPSPRNTQQKFGTVKLEFCLDKYGRFIGQPTIAAGSTTTDAYLVRITKENILRVKFSPTGGVKSTNCGIYTVHYKRGQ